MFGPRSTSVPTSPSDRNVHSPLASSIAKRIGVEIGKLPRFDTDDEPYFDRLDQELNRLLPSIDAAANGLGMLLDLQLNERAYLVSVVATIFVPLSFITGFFGMNFG